MPSYFANGIRQSYQESLFTGQAAASFIAGCVRLDAVLFRDGGALRLGYGLFVKDRLDTPEWICYDNPEEAVCLEEDAMCAALINGAAFSYAPQARTLEARPVRPRVPPCRPFPRRVEGNFPGPAAKDAVGPLCRACGEGRNLLTKAEVEGRYSSRIKRGGQAPSPARLAPPRNAGRGTLSWGSEFRSWGLPGG